MQITIADPQKGTLETIEIEFTGRNTTVFDIAKSKITLTLFVQPAKDHLFFHI
jgi:hypothetical protein